MEKNALEKIIRDLIKSKLKSLDILDIIKRKVSKQYKINCPKNIDLLKEYHKLTAKGIIKENKNIERILKTRPVRSLSGIVNVSVLTKPYECPGNCIYCPNDKTMPRSYLPGEPAAERAKKLKFNPYLQTLRRIEVLDMEGHSTNKIDLRIIGGTWSFYNKKYQNWFIKRCFDATNKQTSKNLLQAQKLNEKAKNRITGISIETRPDYIDLKEIKNLRELGITRVELGIQSIYDDVLKLNKRGHGIKETIEATRLLKDAGFKICYQIMPNLLGSSYKKDLQMIDELFNNSNFQPDYLKIYPTALLKNTPLYKHYKKGDYKIYSENELKKLLKNSKAKIPYYVRIQRIMRDIPSALIVEGGVKTSNLRQLIASEMEKENLECKCIRCREVKANYNPKDKLFLFKDVYSASGGKEIFLSFATKDRKKLYSSLRLRLSSKENEVEKIFPFLKSAAIIREIQTYGNSSNFKEKISAQHRGLGKKLIKEAEKLVYTEFNRSAKKEKTTSVAIISGIGTREYFKKLGYKLKDTYMVKRV